MIDEQNIKSSIFLSEFETYSMYNRQYLPMESNADILSSLKILNLIENDKILANQIIWTYNIIKDKYKYGNPADLINFNNKSIYESEYEKLIYGIFFNVEELYNIINPLIDNNKYKSKILSKIKL